MLPEEPLLVAPSVAELQAAVEGTLLRGDPALLNREAMDVLVAGMTAEHVLERLTEGVAVITPGDRSDVVLAVVSAHAAEGLSVAVVRHPQRWARAAPVDRVAGVRSRAAAADHRDAVRHLRDGAAGWRRRAGG